MRQSSKAEIGIILPQKYPVLRPGGEHTVRLINALIDEIVYENTYIGLVSGEHKRILFLKVQVGINTSHKALTSRFLVSCGTINLTSQKEVIYYLGA